jgi:uncharacterized protein
MVSQKKKTIVLGASANPMRYSNLAVHRLRANQHPVIAIGKRAGAVSDVSIQTDHPHFDDVNTITLYLNANNQKQYYDYIMSLHPKRIIFNPGAENPELAKMASKEGIQAIEACTLVLLSTGQY